MKWIVPVTLLCLLCWPAAVAAKQQVERNQVTLRSGPGSFYPAAGELSKGDEVEVLEEKGPWARVRAGGDEGFVPRSALQAQKSSGLGGLSRAIGTKDAGAESETAGVKGFNSSVEEAHAKERGQDWSALVKLEQQTVSPKDMLVFLRARGFVE
jgi:uncharacterized protein YgiM (DUF1202 family)